MATNSFEPNGEQRVNGGGPHHNLKEDESVGIATQWMSSIVLPMALRSAVELGVFDVIARGGEGAELSAKDIAAQIGSKNPDGSKMLDRILRLLVSHSVLNCSVNKPSHGSSSPQILYYSLTPAAKHYVTDADGVSFGPVLALLVDKVFYQSWSELNGAILEGGIPFNKVYGMHAFEYPSVDPRFNEVFNKAMLNNTTITMKRILQLYKGFENINKLVDVGGGLGINLKLITSKYPHVKGINFDLPHVVEHATVYAGVEHVGGDMFDSIPKGDAIFMKWILHDWGDKECLKILKNCYEAIPDDGKLIVVDAIIPSVPETSATAKNIFSSDLIMMTQNPGGKERTKQDLMELATGSGFRGIKFVCCVTGFWVMEFFK